MHIAHDLALDLAADHRTPDCEACTARLGTRLSCPACWGWHRSRKTPPADQPAAIAAILAADNHLTGELRLLEIGRAVARFFAERPETCPTDDFLAALEGLGHQLATMVMPTTRRRRALQEIVALLPLERAVACCGAAAP